jgi:hypothetical protein
MMRMTIGVVFAAAFTISGAAQEFIAQSGVPAVAFPKPDRPVADIVSPIWHDEKERDDAGEPGQLVRLLGIKSGMTVADIGAVAATTSYGCRRLSDPTAASSQKTSCPSICKACASGCAISDCRTL